MLFLFLCTYEYISSNTSVEPVTTFDVFPNVIGQPLSDKSLLDYAHQPVMYKYEMANVVSETQKIPFENIAYGHGSCYDNLMLLHGPTQCHSQGIM